MAVQLKRKPFTLDQYHQMVRSGVLVEGDRVELIEGEILEMAAIGSKHSAQVNRLNNLLPQRLLELGLSQQVLVAVQNPVELGPKSEPQPDVALLRWRDDFYANGHPQASDVLLLIEVADSTLEFDREVKGPLYARSGIQDYWLINLQDGVIEVHREPSLNGYGQVETFRRGKVITMEVLPKLSCSVDDILG